MRRAAVAADFGGLAGRAPGIRAKAMRRSLEELDLERGELGVY